MYVIQRDLEVKRVKYATSPNMNTVQEEQGTCQSFSAY
jgi:hypothetical protein